MLCRPQFIVHGRLNAFKGYTTVQIRSTLVANVGMAHAQQDCLNAKFQVLVQINKVLLYNKR